MRQTTPYPLTLLFAALLGFGCQPNGAPPSQSEGSPPSLEASPAPSDEPTPTPSVGEPALMPSVGEPAPMPTVDEPLDPAPSMGDPESEDGALSAADLASHAVLVEEIEGFAEIVQRNSADCDALGVALTTFAEEHGEAFMGAIKAVQSGPKPEMALIEEHFGPRLVAAEAKYAMVRECKSNPAVAAALKTLFDRR